MSEILFESWLTLILVAFKSGDITLRQAIKDIKATIKENPDMKGA